MLLMTTYTYTVFAQWTNLNAPTGGGYTQVYSTLAVSPNGKNIAAFTQKTSTLTFQSTYHYTTSHDFGATWQVYSVPDTAGLTGAQLYNTAPLDIFWDGDDLYVQDANPITKLKKSSNFGASFTVQNGNYITQSRIVQSPNGNWYKFNASVLYSSSDKGVTWNSIPGAGTNFMEYCVANNGNLVATYNSGVAYSTNGGNTWIPATFSPTGSWIDSKNSISKASDGTLLYLCSTASKIYKSIDNGVTWQQITATLPVNPIKMLYSGTDIITLSTNASTHKSTNGGTSFTQMTPITGGILSSGNGMANSSTDIFISGMSAIYKYASTTGIAENTNQNNIILFPNPSTGIFTCISSLTISEIKIYNELGEIILNNKIDSPTTTINLTGNPKGIYFYQLINDNRIIKLGKIIIE